MRTSRQCPALNSISRFQVIFIGRILGDPRGYRVDRRMQSATVSSLIPRRWTHSDELESGALGPRSVVVHLIREIVDYAPRPDSNGVVLIELRPRADQEGSRQHGDESLIRMRVRLAPLVWAAFGDLDV